ncbi:MAG: hypothetical protein ABI780_11525 [Ardenticatenales bacterium]
MQRLFARLAVQVAVAATLALGFAGAATAATTAATSDAGAEARIYLPYGGRDVTGSQGRTDQFGGTIHGVVTDGRYAFAGIGPRFVVLDLEPVGAPAVIWQSPVLPGMVDVQALTQQRVWLTLDWGKRLVAYDVHDPRAPRPVFDGAPPNGWHDIIGASGNLLIARADWNAVVGLIDISAPSRPLARGAVTISQGGVATRAVVRGHYVYVARYIDSDTTPGPPGIAVIDIDRPAAPREVAFLPLQVAGGGWDDSPQFIDGTGDLLVAASYCDAWWIDVARPDVPRVVGMRRAEPYQPPDAGLRSCLHDVAMVGRTTWLLTTHSATQSELVALDTADPSRPRTMARQVLPPDAYHLARGGDRLVAFENGYGDAALTAVDIAQPEAPRVRGRFATLGYASQAWPFGDRLFAISGGIKLGIIGVARPAGDGSPIDISSGAAPIWSTVANGRFVGATHDEVWTLRPDTRSGDRPLVGWDLTDPHHPIERWHGVLPVWPNGFAAVGDVRFFFNTRTSTADGTNPPAGLWTLDMSDANAPLAFGPLSGDAGGAPKRLAIAGNRLFAATERALWSVDINQPRAWHELARAPITLQRIGTVDSEVLDLSVEGGVVLVTTSAGVAAFDAADGAGLQAIGPLMIPPSDGASTSRFHAKHYGAASAAGRLYTLTALEDGLSERVTAFDVTRPLAPVPLWSRTYPGDLPAYPCALGADARSVVIAACDAGLMVMDAQ